MKLAARTYFLLLLMVTMVVVIVASIRLEAFESRLLPLILSVGILFLGAIELSKEITSKGNRNIQGPVDGNLGKRAELKQEVLTYLPTVAWVVGLLIGVYLLGMVIATFIFIVAYMKTHKTKWLGSIITGVVTSGLFWAVFDYALKLTLYRGIFKLM